MALASARSAVLSLVSLEIAFACSKSSSASVSRMSGEECPGATRLTDVPGYDLRVNDLAFISCDEARGEKVAPTCVIFFGGDVQDWKENMEVHRDNKRYVEWNLESTGRLLASKFADAIGVFVVHPSRMTLKTFSCYDNFVPSSAEGSPSHVPHFHALEHLAALVANGLKQVSVNLLQRPRLVIVGFSKGCVVLNQLAREIHEGVDSDVISRIEAMYWLDGGHSGGKDTWVTDADVLKSLAKSCIRIEVHVTPYQVRNPNKPWQKKEEKVFSERLRKLSNEARFVRVLHFGDEELSFDNHFGVLKAFTV